MVAAGSRLAVERTLVSKWVATKVALGMTAPLESVARAVMEPVMVCALDHHAKSIDSKIRLSGWVCEHDAESISRKHDMIMAYGEKIRS